MANKNYWLVLHEDKSFPIGGVKQAHRLIEHLNLLGNQATVIQQDNSFHPGWFKSNVPTISKKDFFNKKDLSPKQDVLIMPETSIFVIKKYFPEIPKIVFNQNASYTFGINKKVSYKTVIDIYTDPIIAHVICVSKADYYFLTSILGLSPDRVSLIINAIETDLFMFGVKKKKQISFMPRKNPLHAQIVVSALIRKSWFKGWKVKLLDNMNQDEVAKSLMESLGFLAFGHPEGFGLPLAEACACGCQIIGYSGIGGKEIFSLDSVNGNDYQVDYGDYAGFLNGVKTFLEQCDSNMSLVVTNISSTSRSVREIYSPEKMNKSIKKAIEDWTFNLDKINHDK